LHYRSCDLEGPDGVAALLEPNSDKSCRSEPPVLEELLEEWRKNAPKLLPSALAQTEGSLAGPTKPARTTTDEYHELLLKKTSEALMRETERNEKQVLKLRRSQVSYAFVHFFNRVLRGEVELPAKLKNEILSEDNAVSRWNPLWMMKRWENRRFLDRLLDKATPQPPDEAQQPSSSSCRAAAMKLFYLRLMSVLGFWVAAGTVTALCVWVGADIWHDVTTRVDTEPFSLTNGISAWPAILLRLAAVVLSVFFCYTLYSQMRTMFYELTRCYRLPLEPERPWRYPWKRISNSIRNIARECFLAREDKLPPSGRVCASELWHRYRQQGHWMARVVRAGIPCLIYFLLAGVIFQLFGSLSQPMRGGSDSSISEWARFKLPGSPTWPVKGYMVVNLSFFFLTFLTIDAARLCCRFIQRLSAWNVDFPDATRDHFRRRRGGVSPDCLDEWIGTRLIADLTERVGTLLWFPGIVFLLLLVARLPQWDHWPWHAAHIVITVLNFCIALASVLILQRAARRAKNAAEERLTAKVKQLQAQIAPSAALNDAAQAEKLLEEIRKIRRGAFVPFWENPVLGALMVGPGGLTVLQMAIWLVSR
jgi:hypothetical protein